MTFFFNKKFRTLDPHPPAVLDKVLKKSVFLDHPVSIRLAIFEVLCGDNYHLKNDTEFSFEMNILCHHMALSSSGIIISFCHAIITVAQNSPILR